MAGDALTLPAEIVDKHLAPAAAPEPAADPKTPEPKPKDKAEEAPKDEAEDKVEEEAGAEDAQEPDDDAPEGDEPPEDEEEDDAYEDDADDEETDDEPTADQTSDEEESDEDVLDTVSAADLKRIEADPVLRKQHRQMQAAFTKKMQGVATREREVQSQQAGLDSLRTPDGMSGYIAQLMEQYPDVVGAAFDAALMSKRGDPAAFLLEIGLAAPKVFEGVYERLVELNGDPAALAAHRRGQEQVRKSSDLSNKERQLAEREKVQVAEAFDRDFLALGGKLEEYAAAAGVQPGEDLAELKEAMLAELKTDQQGRIATTPADIKRLVARVSAAQRVREEKIRKRVERELGVKDSERSVDNARKLAADARKPARQSPRGVKRNPPVEHPTYTPKAGEDDLAGFLKHKLIGADA